MGISGQPIQVDIQNNDLPVLSTVQNFPPNWDVYIDGTNGNIPIDINAQSGPDLQCALPEDQLVNNSYFTKLTTGQLASERSFLFNCECPAVNGTDVVIDNEASVALQNNASAVTAKIGIESGAGSFWLIIEYYVNDFDGTTQTENFLISAGASQTLANTFFRIKSIRLDPANSVGPNPALKCWIMDDTEPFAGSTPANYYYDAYLGDGVNQCGLYYCPPDILGARAQNLRINADGSASNVFKITLRVYPLSGNMTIWYERHNYVQAGFNNSREPFGQIPPGATLELRAQRIAGSGAHPVTVALDIIEIIS